MPRNSYTASLADRHILYQEAVQNPDFEVDMIRRMYRKYYENDPHSLKEDFCGTFLLCRKWIEKNKHHSAIGVDLDKKTLRWGEIHNREPMKPEQKKRLTISCANVLDVSHPKVDIIVAFNFSYWILQKQDELLSYFKNALHSLQKDGLLLLDAFGGPEAEREQEEERKCDGFKYVWEQSCFYPITREMGCKIHFRFKDKTELRNAYVYRWRLWTPPEISSLLYQAGFKVVDWYLEGTDHQTNEGNGVFRKSKRGTNADTWIAYVAALK